MYWYLGVSSVIRIGILGCGGNFSTPTGTLMSKNFPENYPHNTDCEWLISVEESKRVVLTFQDFDVESSTNCTYDYVAVCTLFENWREKYFKFLKLLHLKKKNKNNSLELFAYMLL